MDSFSEFMLIVPNINSSASGDDESYADDGPCNVKATNCTFNGMESKLKISFWHFSHNSTLYSSIISFLGESGFVCDGSRCLRKHVVCDGLVHCKDGTDEAFERCAVTACPPEKFQCKHSKQCIPKSFLCDGNPDCSDKSDEMENCTECPEFRCNNGLCVQYDKVCDGMHLLIQID